MFIRQDCVNAAICFHVWPIQLLYAKSFHHDRSLSCGRNESLCGSLTCCRLPVLFTIFSLRQEMWCVFNANLTVGMHSFWFSPQPRDCFILFIFSLKNKNICLKINYPVHLLLTLTRVPDAQHSGSVDRPQCLSWGTSGVVGLHINFQKGSLTKTSTEYKVNWWIEKKPKMADMLNQQH